MSTTIDEKVVQMRFDNKQFENNVATSMSTLDKLKKSLDFDDASKSFEGLNDAAKKCDMSVLGSSVEAVHAKFSALEVIALTALSNITNSAINAGKQIVSSLTIEPISTGFSEYELKMNSIQTIMASTGESLDRVNQKLDELNTYSDRTIYSFSDMTSNIGKFTNAGVKLDDAVAAIQGVSNVAAVSGANANEASRAMYNFAQALSAGYVKLIDWKSIENANMATVEFKTQLLESAVAAGTLEKTADGMYKVLTTNANGSSMGDVIDATHNFNDSLSYQWMTTEALTSTLKDYADETTEIGKKAFAAAQDVKTWTQLLDTLKESAQSGWATTWQLIVGDYEEAKDTLRTFSEFFSTIIDGASDARNSLLQETMMSSWGQLKNRVNETGMSVDTFSETLRETAESSVDGLDKMIEEVGSFDATLSEGWLTTDILSDTLDKMVSSAIGAEVSISDLSDEELKNIGYTQDQIDALRALSNEAKTSSGNISELVNNMTRQSGRELLFDSILNAAKAAQSVFQALKGAWEEIFPPATSDKLYGIIESLHSASERLRDFFALSEDGKPLNETFANLQNTFKGIFAVLDIVKTAFTSLWRAISPAGSTLGDLLSGVLGVTGSFGEWVANLDETIKKNDIFYKAFKTVIDFIKGAVATVKEFAKTIAEKLNFPSLEEAKESIKSFLSVIKEKFSSTGMDLLHNLLENICERAVQVKNVIVSMKDGIVSAFSKVDAAAAKSKFVQILTSIWNLIKSVASAIWSILGKAVSGLIDTLGNANFDNILDFLNALATGGLVAAIKNFTDMGTGLKDALGGFGDNITKILDGVRGCLEAWQTSIKADAILKIAEAIVILAAGLLILSTIDSEKLTGSIVAITAMFVELMGSMSVLGNTNVDSKKMGKTATAMIEISAALLVLSLAVKSLASLEPDKLAEGLVGVGVLLAEIDVFLNTAKFDKNASKTATAMILFAAAIKILASAAKSMAELSWEELAKGLVGVGALLAEVDIFLNTAKFSGKSVSTATGIVILAAALKILASVCKTFAGMSWEEIGKGLASVGALLLEVTAFTNLSGNAKHVISTGLALIEIAAAMKIFASAMKSFAGMSWEEIGKGLTAMGGALAEVAIAVNLMPKNMVGIGTGLVIVGAALEIVTNVLGKMGGMSWEEIGKGLATMGGALAELAIGLNVMNGTLGGSAALLTASAALLVLVPVLKSLGGMSWEEIAKGLVTIAGAFTVLGVAGALIGSLAPTILVLSAAFAVFGVGAIAAGAGLALISAGITALATALGTGVTIIVAGLSTIIIGIAGLIPAIVTKIGEAIIALCGVIAEGAPAIAEAVKSVVLSLIDMLVECVPAIVDGAFVLITGVLESLVTYAPQIIDSLMQFLIEILEGIARNMPELIQAAMDVIGAFFAGVLNAISEIDTGSLIESITALGLLTALVAALGTVAALIPAALIGVAGMGVVITELAIVLAAVGALAQIPGLDWLISEGGNLLQTIGEAIGGFVGGIVGGFMSGVSSSFPQIGADLSAFMTNVQPFIDGASGITPDLLTGIASLTGAIMLITAADLLEGLTSWLTGGSSLADFGNELVPFGESMVAFSDSITDLDADLVDKAATAGKTLAEMAATLPNSGGVLGFFAGENDMDTFGKQLVVFGTAMKEFSIAVSGVDSDVIQNGAIAGKTLAEMASTLPNTGGVVGFFTGENDMDTFGEQLVPFGKAVKEYGDAVAGLDVDAVTNSATAGKALTELADTVPNTGGAVTFFTGDNNMDTFGEQLIPFGEAMKAYSDSVSGIDSDAITNSATAGGALAELAANLPNTGGLCELFTGGNDLGTFAESLEPFGKGMKAYSDSLVGFNPDAVAVSATVAQCLSKLQANLPAVGGLKELIEGGNDLGTFAKGLEPFGKGMKAYSDSLIGFNPDAVAASATVAQCLSKLQANLPAVGGLNELIEGGNDLGTFAESLESFGKGMKAYAEAVSGLEKYSSSIGASVIAGSSLIELSKTLPNTGGAIDFFTGHDDFETFSSGIVMFGEAMMDYAEAVSGLEEYSTSVDASVIAGNSLIELSKTLPDTGEVIGFFTGSNDFETFSSGIKIFGEAMMDYAEAVSGLEDYSESVDASVIAGNSLIELSKTLPNTGGAIDFFTGHDDFETFSNGIVIFGEAMMDYALAVNGLEGYSASVDASVIAGNSLIELSKTLPDTGEVISFFTGSNDFETFSNGIVMFGQAMMDYALAVNGLEGYSASVDASVIAGNSLIELSKTLPKSGGAVTFFTGDNDLGTFGMSIKSFGKSMMDYAVAVDGLEGYSGAIEASAIAGKSLVELANTLPKCGGLVSVFTGDSSLSSFGKELAPFGEDLSAYAEAISGVEPDTVTASANAAQALSDLATGLPDSSLFDKWFGGDQTLETFGKDISAFGTAMSDYYSTVSGIDTDKLAGVVTQVWSLVNLANGVKNTDTSGFASFGSSLKSMADAGIAEFTNAFANSDEEVTAAVQGMLSEVSDTLSDGTDIAAPGMRDVMTALAEVITDKTTVISKSVTTAMSGMCTAIRSAGKAAELSVQSVMASALNGASSYTSKFYSLGINAGQGLVNGIYSKLSAASKAGSDLGLAALNSAAAALDSHSPSREFIYLGENMGEGLAIGAKNSIVAAKDATSTMIDEVLAVASEGLDAFEEWAEEKKYYGELSLSDELAGYEQLQTMYAEGSEERKQIDREVYSLQNDLVDSTYQASLDWIEKEKYYNRLSTQEELEAYERMQTRYIEGSEERIAIDKKIYELKNQLVDESYQNSMDWIEEQTYYNKLSLADELAAYKRVQSRYAKGTEERKKMDREVYKLEQEIYEAQQQYIADVQSAQESANEQRLELEEEYAEKVKSINEQLESDIESAWQSYQDSLESRTNSLYNSYGLFDEVSEKEEVSGETLMTNLEDQIEEFQDWQDTLDSLSARGLDEDFIEELQDMGPSAIAQIKALNNMSDDELDKYVSMWSVKHAIAREQATTELEGLREDTLNTISQLQTDAETELSEYQATWQEKMDQITIDCNAELEQLRKDFGEKVGLITTDTEAEMQEMADTAQEILTAAGWSETGQQIVDGITEGVEEGKSSFLDSITQTALDAVEAVNETLDSNSSSTETEVQEITDSAQEIITDAEWEKTGEQIVSDITEGVKDNKTTFLNTMMQDIADAAQKILTDAEWNETGQQIVYGITKGVKDNKSSFLNSITQMALEAVKAVKETLDINSPSKVFRELGNFTSLGFVKGITDYADKSYYAGSEIAESAKDGLSNAMQTVSDCLNGDIDTQPTIRPVLDLSNVAEGAGQLDSLLDYSHLMAFAGQTSFMFSSAADDGKTKIAVDNDGVIQAINGLQGDVAELKDLVGKLQIVLDTGTLVGAIADPMDSALGQRMTYRGRGI